MGTRAILERLKRWDWETILFVLALKAVLLSFAVQAVVTMKNRHDGWLQIWNRWDATHYLTLAENGYTATGPNRVTIVFYPLFPWLTRAVAFLTRNFAAAAFVVSGFASIAAALTIKRLARLDYSEPVARSSVWFLFIFPTAYFLHIGYTESLFLALVLGCFLAARTERWWLAGLLGGLACLTRVNGLLLGPALALEVLWQWWKTRRIDYRWLWLGLVPLGFGCYLWLNYHVMGDPFAFSAIMEKTWFKKMTPPWMGMRDAWLRSVGGINPIESWHEVVFIVFGGVLTVCCWIWSRPSYALWLMSNWLLALSTSFVLGMPRYLLPAFPIFILIARALTHRRLAFAVVSFTSLLFYALYASRFVQGLWAF